MPPQLERSKFLTLRSTGSRGHLAGEVTTQWRRGPHILRRSKLGVVRRPGAGDAVGRVVRPARHRPRTAARANGQGIQRVRQGRHHRGGHAHGGGLDRRSERGPPWRMPVLFGGVYAPSTLGEFLRAFSHGHVRQLQAVSREFLLQLARATPLLPGAGAVTFVDVDSLLRRVYGKQKQGAAFGHAKVGGYQVLLRGLNPLVATISTPDAAPVIAATQLRAGNVRVGPRGGGTGRRSHRDHQSGPRNPTRDVGRGDRGAGRFGVLLPQVIAACRRAGIRFSITIRVDAKVRQAIARSRLMRGRDRIPAAGLGRRATGARYSEGQRF